MAQRKQILMITRPICPPWDEGSKNFAYYLAKEISKDEAANQVLDINLLTKGILADLPSQISQKSIYTNCDFTYFQKIRLLKHLKKFQNKFDVYHYLFTPTKLNSSLIKKFASSKNATTIQTIATLREDLYSDADFKELLFADLIITYSKYAKNKLNKIGFDNVYQVYPGIDLDYFSPQNKDGDLMQEFRIKADDFIVTYNGEYTRLGATDDIVKTIINTKEKNIKYLLGLRIKNKKDLAKKEEVMSKLKNENKMDQVIFVDTFSDMAKMYNLSDVIIFPVRNMKGKFDIPLAAVEPMACEKPVILSDLPILDEFASPNHSVRIKRGDTDELLAQIINLYKHRYHGKMLGKKARQFIQQNFDIKETANEYIKIYKGI